MSCGYDHHHCGRGHHGTVSLPFYPHYAAAARADYVRMLEYERSRLEQRLRRLESEVAELRQGGGPAGSAATL